jgi:hypothetical protein
MGVLLLLPAWVVCPYCVSTYQGEYPFLLLHMTPQEGPAIYDLAPTHRVYTPGFRSNTWIKRIPGPFGCRQAYLKAAMFALSVHRPERNSCVNHVCLYHDARPHIHLFPSF